MMGLELKFLQDLEKMVVNQFVIDWMELKPGTGNEGCRLNTAQEPIEFGKR